MFGGSGRVECCGFPAIDRMDGMDSIDTGLFYSQVFFSYFLFFFLCCLLFFFFPEASVISKNHGPV